MQLPLCPPETILTSASACTRAACVCATRCAVSLWRCVAHLHTHNPPDARPRECARAKKHAIAHTPRSRMRGYTHTRECATCACTCRTIHHGLHLSPKAHERHVSWAPIMPLPTTTSDEGRQTAPRLLEYNDYYHLPPRMVLQ